MLVVERSIFWPLSGCLLSVFRKNENKCKNFEKDGFSLLTEKLIEVIYAPLLRRDG